MQELEVLDRAEHRLHLAWGNVLVNLWHGPVGVHDVRAAGDAGRALGLRYPAGIGSLNVIKEGVPLPDTATRQQAEHNLTESQQWMRASAVVIEGRGFWVSAARSVYSALQLVVNQHCPQRVFAAVLPACEWLGREFPSEGNLRELARRIDDERKSLPP